MIKIDGLTKIYRAKNKKDCCVAIDDMNLVLPEKGMVFIVGKSGSGKSTLLNVLGGLDSFDSGEITVFGNSLSTFNPSQYEAYRSDLIGFVFQDYHLLDELTVLENITLFSSQNTEADQLEKVLKTVDIFDLQNRYPKELSGGQKQRVAIARGIVKQPKLLLCDEPTGNLDRKTSIQIMDLLKEISREKLVVIVSHNLTEAEHYADRIVELADGKIVSDITKDENYVDNFSLVNGCAVLPYHSRLSEDEIDKLNGELKNGALHNVVQNRSGFNESEIDYQLHSVKMVPQKIKPSNIRTLFTNFLFSKKKQSFGAILIVTIMFLLFSVIQSFVAFDPNGALAHSLNTRDPLAVVEKDYSTFPLNIYDDVSSIGGCKNYSLYSQTIWTDNPHGSSWDYKARLSDAKNLSDIYIHETYGLLVCDEDYLKARFGVDGEIVLLEGHLDDSYDAGILITDYFADSFIRHQLAKGSSKYITYNSLIGTICPAGLNLGGKVSGIIYTGYETKYESLINEYMDYDEKEAELTREEFEEAFRNNPLYIEFVDDILIDLGISYTLDANYVDNVSFSDLTMVRTADLYVSGGGPEVCASNLTYTSSLTRNSSVDYTDSEIGVPFELYNTIFGTSYTAEDMYSTDSRFGQTITFKRYVDNTPKRGLVYSKTFTVKCLTNTMLEMNDESMRSFKKEDWQPSRIYFLNPTDVGSIVDYVTENEYKLVSNEHSALKNINDIIQTFRGLFSFLQVVIISLIAIYLFGYGFKSIRSNTYQIGVIKALGARNHDVRKIFVSKTLIVGLIISLTSVVTAICFLGVADNILVSSISKIAKIPLYDLSIIKPIFILLLLDVLILLGVVIVSSLLTALVLRSIKPVQIIKAKE